jgi:AhpD family alkylhydroperoxidase
MSSDLAAFYKNWKGDRGRINQHAPELGRGYAAFYQSIMKDGVLSLREKELIATAIAVVTGCESCIYLHTRGAVKSGATREQVLEAAAVATMMHGGPAFTHVPDVIRALEYLDSGDDASRGQTS